MSAAARRVGSERAYGSPPARPTPVTRPPSARAAYAITPARVVRDPGSARVVQGPARERHEPDYAILVVITALAAIGVLMIYSSSAVRIARDPGGDLLRAVLPEAGYTLAGLVAMLAFSRLDYRWLRVVSVPAYLLAIGLLVLVLVSSVLGPIGPLSASVSGGAARWLQIGALPQMHPAEVAKLALVVYLAHWLARRGHRAGSFMHGTLPFLVIVAPIILLVAAEPDLGTTGVITLAAFCVFFAAGANLRQLLALVPVGLVAFALYVSLKAYQSARIDSFLDPWSQATTDGYHTVQGLLALALGGVFGAGLGQSRLPGGLNLPNADNDYIFAMVGQEFGLVGGVLVIGLFLFFAWRGVRVALRAPDTFGALLALGITAVLTVQSFINIGVVVNLLPVTGVPLPFVSAGGTSLVVSCAAVGILLSISRETIARGSWNDAHPGRGRGYGRPRLPGPGGPALADPAVR